MRASTRSRLLTAAATGAAILVLAGCGAGAGHKSDGCPPLPDIPAPPSVHVPRGLDVRLRPHEVEALFLARRGPEAWVGKVAAYRTWATLAAHEDVGGEPAGADRRIGPVWFVAGWAEFSEEHFGRELKASCGFVIYRDSDGSSLGGGFPWSRR